MQVDSDPQVEPARAWASADDEIVADAQNGQGSLSDLMAELRTQTEEVLTQLAAAGTWIAPDDVRAEAEAEPTVRVPLALLEQVAETVAEARAALARSRGNGAVEPRPREQADDPERERARMVSLNMALNGAPRSETQLYLDRNFGLADTPEVTADAYERARQILSG